MVFLCYTLRASNILPQQIQSVDFNNFDFIMSDSTVLKYLNSTHAHPRVLCSTDAKYYIDYIIHLESYELKLFL